ncbi:MAG: protein kinase [Byssovorax sp.]
MGATLFEKKYVIRELIGKGGMGEVYAATHVISKAEVAIKCIPRSRATEELRARLLKESAALGALIHPNIVRLHDAGVTDEGVVYIIMERVPGEPLRKLIASAIKKKTRLDIRAVLYIMAQVAEAMQFAHKKGVLHRDLKPENIMVGEGSRAVVLDFGVARLGGKEAETGPIGAKTDPMRVMGTPSYMAPEQVRALPLDGRTDIYAMGVILYEAISNRRPYTEDQTTSITEIMAHHAFANPVPLRDFVSDLPPRIWSIVERCLEKDPADRFATMGDLARELRACMREILRASAQKPAAPADPFHDEADDEPEIDHPTLERSVGPRLLQETAPMPAGGVARSALPFSEPPRPAHAAEHRPREVRETEPMPLAFRPLAALPFKSNAALAEEPAPIVESGVHFKQVPAASVAEPTPAGMPSSPAGFAFDPTWPVGHARGAVARVPAAGRRYEQAPMPRARRVSGVQIILPLIAGLVLAASMLVVVMVIRVPHERDVAHGSAGGPATAPSGTVTVVPSPSEEPVIPPPAAVPSASAVSSATVAPSATAMAAPSGSALPRVPAAPKPSLTVAKPQGKPKPAPAATGKAIVPLFDFGSKP